MVVRNITKYVFPFDPERIYGPDEWAVDQQTGWRPTWDLDCYRLSFDDTTTAEKFKSDDATTRSDILVIEHTLLSAPNV